MPITKQNRALQGYGRIATALNGKPGRVHMMGVGGVGMAGVALLLNERGWNVTGCDAYPGPLINWLREKGIHTDIGHDVRHLDVASDFIVRSPAVSLVEPELLRARQDDIPVIDRGRLLPALLTNYRTIAVAGTHGKTTTASMTAWIFKQAGVKTSYCIGGVCPCLGAVAHAEVDGFMVVEADESDGTLRYYEPDVAVITSMDIDHIDYFQTHDMLMNTYREFAFAAPLAVYPAEDQHAAVMLEQHPRAVSTGLADTATIRATNLVLHAGESEFDVSIRGEFAGRIRLGVPGHHNILNALSAIAVAEDAGVSMEHVKEALASFRLPLRRFEQVVKGRGVTVISDYAHHPVEISALLAQAKLAGARRIIGVFQPHRYSRTKAFLNSFVDVLTALDFLVLAPVYSASEPFIAGGTSDDLYREFLSRGLKRQVLAASVPDAWSLLKPQIQPGDLVLIIGAGDVDVIGKWAQDTYAEAIGII